MWRGLVNIYLLAVRGPVAACPGIIEALCNIARSSRGNSLRQKCKVRSVKPSKKDEIDSLGSNVPIKETDGRRRKKSEALTTLENAHCDYYEMKMRMHMEIPGLLNRMEAAKQLLGGHKFKTWKLSLAEIEGNIATIDPCGLTLPELA
ncbi:hypothetical protein FXO37_04177 [Capsicum annuum]|nr:hypothetical protein FXO37_04177 [Capsicum annuum]